MAFASEAARDTALSTVKADGMYAFITTSHRLFAYDGSVWNIVHEPRQSWNVTAVTQSGSVACTTTRGYYQRCHGVWRAQITVTIGANGTAGNAVTVPTPFTLADVNDVGGSWSFQDVSIGRTYGGAVIPLTTVTMGLTNGAIDATAGQLGISPNFAIASPDVLRVSAFGSY